LCEGYRWKEYYGILEDDFELYYVKDNRAHNANKVVDVNHTKRHQKYDPSVLASQMTQACSTPCLMQDTRKKDWWAIMTMKLRPTIDAPKEELPF